MAGRLPGGNLITGWGGYVNVEEYVNGLVGTSQAGGAIAGRRIDVARWGAVVDWVSPELTHGGRCGAMLHETVCQDWTARMVIWWDINNPPWPKFHKPDYFGLKLLCGSPRQFGAEEPEDLVQAPAPFNPTDLDDMELFPFLGELDGTSQTSNFARQYRAPLARLTNIETDDSSEGEGIVRAVVTVRSDSLLWHLQSKDDLVEFNTYVQLLRDRHCFYPQQQPAKKLR